MKTISLIVSALLFLIFFSCSSEKSMNKIIDESLSFAVEQYSLMADVMLEKPDLLPRTIDAEGNLVTAKTG